MKNLRILGLLALAIVVSGCSGDLKSSLGLHKSVPDEFSVVEGPALTVPPSFELPDPNTKTVVRSRLGAHSPAALSPAEVSFLRLLDADDAGPISSAKALIDNDYAMSKQKSSGHGVIRRTVKKFNQSDSGPVIDPEKESTRLVGNNAAGKQLNSGEIALQGDERSTLGKIWDWVSGS